MGQEKEGSEINMTPHEITLILLHGFNFVGAWGLIASTNYFSWPMNIAVCYAGAFIVMFETYMVSR